MNILVIDDHQIIKEGIEARIKKALPEAKSYFANNVRLAISKMRELKIDLIFCDLEFSGETEIDGFYIVKNILELEPKIKVIALTNYNTYRIMKKAMAGGCHSFLGKGCSFEEFSETLHNVIESGHYESPTMKSLLKKKNQFLNTIFSESLYGISSLSNRERELVLLCAKTTCRQELAEIMKVTPYTIDTYFKKALSKLNLKHRKELSLFSAEFESEVLKYE